MQKTVGVENVLFQEPMGKHTTFRVGGEAEVFVNITDQSALEEIVIYLERISQNFFILGRGSNLLVGDKGYKGLILNIGHGMNKVEVKGTTIMAQAGALLPVVAQVAAENGLTGMEFASGIPGSIGGAIVMNAGAYEGEMSHIVKSVTVLDRNGEKMELDHETMEFGYRTSIIKNRPFVVVSVILELEKGIKEEISAKMVEFNKRRREKQPLEYPSAGSTFKRPEGYYAGKLIMDAGLRGFRIGGAQVSEKHCGFVINLGNATAADVKEVIDEVSEHVKEQFGVVLEPEIIRIGEF